ncbi:SEC-C metal-binding domain-containing protein [Haliangium sp.]|uniref:SEC-C metal-binding domain-containing protein n=1 Tax=Haliangium sp. TaxID=2663208 RepID=UPI003D0EBFA3
MATVSRNDPCPCGSGKKYKHCHLNKPIDTKSPRLWIPLFLCVIAIGAGILVGLQHRASTGISVSAGGLIVLGILWLLRSPPPPNKGGGDPGAINFGG